MVVVVGNGVRTGLKLQISLRAFAQQNGNFTQSPAFLPHSFADFGSNQHCRSGISVAN
jgi:hypothetical protein